MVRIRIWIPGGGLELRAQMVEPYGVLAMTSLDRAVIAATSRLPDNWLGLRLAILLRRIVTMRLSGDAGLDIERWGLQMRLHPRRNGCEKGLLFTPQMFEVPERAELAAEIAQVVAAGRAFVFIDIGANVGLFSLFVASRAGRGAVILAFEPEPENVRRLQFNIDANPGLPIHVFPFALADKEGNLLLKVDRRDRGGTRTFRADDGVGQADTSRVRCRPLLDVLEERGVQSIDALKIDVEGVEDVILVPFFRDAPKSLWPRLLIIEDTSNVWQVDLLCELGALGYSVAARTKLNVLLRR
jgi:FkbM family methyltransferase